MHMKVICLTTLAACATTAFAHPGNGIVAISANAVVIGDAVSSTLWRFEKGKSPVRLARNFHCHWVTRDPDGELFAETLHETGGAWESAVYRLEGSGAKPKPAIRNADLGNLMFVPGRANTYIFQKEGRLVKREADGKVVPFGDSKARVGNVAAYHWGPGEALYFAEGDSVRRVTGAGVYETVGKIRGKVTDQLYAGPGGIPRIWGVAADAKGRAYAAVPALGQILKIQGGRQTVVFQTRDHWKPVGVAVHGENIFVLENKTLGNDNFGPRVRVVRPDGKIELVGAVNQ